MGWREYKKQWSRVTLTLNPRSVIIIKRAIVFVNLKIRVEWMKRRNILGVYDRKVPVKLKEKLYNNAIRAMLYGIKC